MTDTTVSITEQPSPRAIAARDRSAPKRITGRLKRAIDLMVWEGLTDSEAAVHDTVKMNVLSIRWALNKRHVRDYLISQRDVLLTREGPRNVHAMIAVRNQTSNQMARVAAVKALEQLEETAGPTGSRGVHTQQPGFIVQVVVQGAQAAVSAQERQIEAKPLIEHEMGADADRERET